MDEIRVSIKKESKEKLKVALGSIVGVVIICNIMTMIPILGQLCFPVITFGMIYSVRKVMNNEGFDFNDLISGFGPDFGNIMVVGWLRSLIIWLGSLLCVFPGIYLFYVYRFTDYIVSENPDMDYKEVFALSKKITKGRLFDLFIFDFSFIGWAFLCMLTCGIALFYVLPYIAVAELKMYEYCRDNIKEE